MRMCNTRIEKYLIRKAFEGENILPENVLWRRKEAFSDGVSSTENSWHIILKQHVEKNFTNDEYDEMLKQSQLNKTILKETAYYKSIYKKYYKSDRIIPYYWLPKYCDGLTDPSAREIV
jgi:asparagine synthase (glutamine-hydrolysing)